MASVSNVTLAIANGSSSLMKSATVSGTLTFDASDVGKKYHLAIALVGEDKSGDTLPSTDPVGDDEIYAFTWGLLLAKKPYKVITVAAAGSQPFTETRSVNAVKLDEDPGKLLPNGEVDINTPLPGLPLRDEVYARATLSGAPVSARSATLTVGIGA